MAAQQPLIKFWTDQLLGKPPLLLLPTDKPRTSNASSLFQVPVSLPAEQAAKLAAIGQNASASLFPDTAVSRSCKLSWVVLAAFQVLLARYSRQDDITVGTPKAAGEPELLPLRVDLEKNPTFAELVKLNASKSKEICQHSEVSVAQLAQAVGADKFDFSLGLHPVFQAAFVLDGCEEARRLSQGFNLDVLLELREVKGVLEGHLCGKETFFAVKTIERMAKHFRNLVGSIVELSEKPIAQLDFVDSAERDIVLNSFNATAVELPPPYAGMTIHGIFEYWASRTPDAKAISFEDKYLTYRQLDERANQLARFLEANGVRPEQPVGVMLERSLELMVAMMGVLKAGGAFVPMDPEYPADRLAIMAEDAEVPILLSMSKIDAYVPLPPSAKRVNLDTGWAQIAQHSAARPQQPRSHPEGLAYIIFTSGSTGRPKGTLLQHSGLINYLYYLVSTHDLSAKDVFLQKTPISFDVSVRELFFPFSVGAELVFAGPGGHRDTQYLAELIAARGITCCSFVPSQLEVFLQEVDGSACRALRRVFVSGEALPPTSVAKFLEQLPLAQLHNLYGPTEATVDVTGYDVRQHNGRATVPIGYPIANVKMYVLDAQLRPLPVGVPGELMISSRQLARGYIKRPDLTAEKFIDCPFGTGEYGRMYRTGDLARWLPEGVIEFLGRLDHQVKLRGFRIELGEIENGLCNCPGLRQAVVVVVKDHAGTSHLVSYVTPEVVDIPAVVRELSQNVPEYMVPEIIMPLKALPTLPNGKVNRRGLPKPDFSTTAQVDYTGPRNDIEEEIQDAWHEVFQLQPISVDADFFRIGGNSLLAGKVISRLRLAFAVELPFTSIFQQRTIADMALFIQSKLQQQPANGGGQAPTPEDINIPTFYGEKERCASTPCSYSQELLLFNNELDPFNPVHNEAAWVRMYGDLDVAALVRALRYLVDRHTVLSSHFALAGVKGPMLKQTRPSKFKIPISYMDLLTGEELQVPEVMQRANSLKRVSLPSKIVKRRARLKTLKTANSQLQQSIAVHQSAGSSSAAAGVRERESFNVANRQASQSDIAHITLPSAATRNLAAQVEAMQYNRDPESAEALTRLRTWLRSGNVTQEQSFTAGDPGAETRTPSNSSSHSSRENLAVRVSDPSSANGDLMGRPGSLQDMGNGNAYGKALQNGGGSHEGSSQEGYGMPVDPKKRRSSGISSVQDTKPLLAQSDSSIDRSLAAPEEHTIPSRTTSHELRTTSHELRTTSHELPRPQLAQKEKSRGCLPSRKHADDAVAGSGTSFRGKSGPSFKGNPLEIEQENETVKEVEAIAWRVKKSLLLHWLTCGIYSTRQSGGTQGFWKGVRENFASFAGYPEPEPSRNLADDDVEAEGGIMIPELATKRSEPSRTLREVLLHEAGHPFKIMQGPMLRVKLVRVRSQEHVLLITMHHSVTDGWSTGIIWKELSAAYNAFHRGKVNVGLAPLPIQYADFATWQRRWLAQGAMSAQMKFWRRHLVGTRQQWDFPTDFFRPAVPAGSSARVPITLKPAVVRAMKNLAGQVNATMFMALLTAYNVLLACYSSEEDLVCGLPYAGRSRAETEGLIGAFLGAVGLRVDLSGNPSFRQVMQRVRKSCLDAFENADVPLHLVMVDILGMNNVGGCAAPPLFQNMFFLHDSSWLEGLNLDGLQVELPAKVEKNVARFDLTLEMTHDSAKDEVAGHIEYRTDLFKRSTIEALVNHFGVVLDGIIAKPDACIWNLLLLTAEDRAVLDSARGVPSHLLPSGASTRHARPRILSPRGYQLPVGIPGQLHVTYATEKQKGLLGKGEAMSLRHNSLMTMISGGLKKLFEDDRDKERREGGPAGEPISQRRHSGEMSSPRRKADGDDSARGTPPLPATRPNAVQLMEVQSVSPRSRPLSPFTQEGAPGGSPEPQPPQASPGPLSDLQPLQSTRRSFRSDEVSLVEHTVETGLIARVSREGKLEILGRVSNKVDIGGVTVQLEDIDRQIASTLPQVERAATVLLRDPEGEQRLVAYVSPAEVDTKELESKLRDHVPSNLIPYLFQTMRRLPTTSHGEIDRGALPPAMWHLKVPRQYQPPQSRLEMEVQLIWQAVLNKKGMISCDADFSEVGGNMMHAVIANGIVREALGVQMPAINIFRDRTIANVAERIKHIRRRGKNKSIGGGPKRSGGSTTEAAGRSFSITR